MLNEVAIEKFLGNLKNIRNYSDLTVSTYRQTLMEAVPFVQCEEMDGKNFCDLTLYRMHITTQSKNTVAKKISALRSFFESLKDEGVKIKLKGATQVKRTKTLPKPEHTDVIKEALGLCDAQDRVILLLLYGVGLRISELSSIKRADVKNGWMTVHGKGDKSRSMPLIPSVQSAVESWIIATDPVCFVLEENGEALSQNQLRYKITKIFQKVGRKVTPHQLRHSFATDLLNGGARINDVSELLGHEHISTTKIYTKLSNQTKLNSYLSAHPLCDPREVVS